MKTSLTFIGCIKVGVCAIVYFMYNGNITIRHTFNNNSGVHYPRKSKIKDIVCNEKY